MPLYLVASAICPWWVVVPFGIVIATLPYGAPVAIIGGVILDALYGTPLPILFNFQYVYTLLFVVVVVLIELLSDRVVD